MSELKSAEKPFDISKWEVWEAYQKVKANQGAPGVDGCTIEEFESDGGAGVGAMTGGAEPASSSPTGQYSGVVDAACPAAARVTSWLT